jgi:hypothetical protein
LLSTERRLQLRGMHRLMAIRLLAESGDLGWCSTATPLVS